MKKISAAVIKENILIAPDIYRMELTLPEDINALPGQFVNVYLDDGAHLLPRPISICRAEGKSLTLVYRAVGVGTKIMSGLTEGDTLRVSDPLGNGFALPESGTVLLVGGGVGVPPMLGTAIAAKAKGLNVIAAYKKNEKYGEKDFADAARDAALAMQKDIMG